MRAFAMAVLDTADDFHIGRVVSRMFNALFANLGVFLPLAALLTIPTLLWTLYTSISPTNMGMTTAGDITAGGGFTFFRMAMFQFAIYLVFGFILQAALVQGTITYLNGERPSFGESFAGALKSVVPLVVIAFLSMLGMMAGIMLLVIPGIIVAMMWAVVVPVLIVEKTGITETFGRSRALTKGYRGRIFLLVLMYLVLALAIGFATRPLMGVSLLATKLGQLNIPYLVVSWAEQAFLTALTAVGIASIYFELRLVKEGVGAQQMAAAFD
jgi:hypothetical protein